MSNLRKRIAESLRLWINRPAVGRPRLLKLVVRWCSIYGVMTFMSGFLFEPPGWGALSAFPTLAASFILMTTAVAISRLSKTAGRLCALTLVLLTIRLPFGYLALAARKGHQMPGVVFLYCTFASLNILTAVFLFGPAYRRIRERALETTVPISS